MRPTLYAGNAHRSAGGKAPDPTRARRALLLSPFCFPVDASAVTW
ncbi:hypothetical protein [Streptomyces kaempferi]|uniref:Uncharacterized protein n=1 Tax=Streptomyces kaempferi TaxID=333725 RepID=A0ABW3XPG2_9ACTN